MDIKMGGGPGGVNKPWSRGGVSVISVTGLSNE